MLQTVVNIWTLFFGIMLTGVTVGSSSSYLGIHATLQGFSNFETGAMMSAYYLGFMVAALKGIKLINHVGHVRTFAALTGVLSATILMHPLWIDPWAWALLRFFSGLSVCIVWLVSESWLNNASDNSNRGRLFSIYIISAMSGMVLGQYLITLPFADAYQVFSVISIIIGLAAVPILLTAVPAPSIEEQTRSIKTLQLLKLAPIGTTGIFLSGITISGLLTLGAVYATQIGFNTSETASFIASIVIGSLSAQLPVSYLSDRFDRRWVASGVAFTGCIAVMATILLTDLEYQDLIIMAFLLGCASMPLYSSFNAMTNDLLDKDQIVSAAGTLLMLNSIGSVMGPLLIANIMGIVGPHGFQWSLGILCLIMGTVSAYRAISYPVTPEEHRARFQMQAPASVGGVLHAEHQQDQPITQEENPRA